jgi:hypothetical protein
MYSAWQVVESGMELVRLETFYRSARSEGSSDEGSGAHVWIHVSPENLHGSYSITLTRIGGDTFEYHALYRDLKKRLQDITPS